MFTAITTAAWKYTFVGNDSDSLFTGFSFGATVAFAILQDTLSVLLLVHLL